MLIQTLKRYLVFALPLLLLFCASSSLQAGGRASFADLNIGQRVNIDGRQLSGKTLLASDIEMQNEHGQEKLKGRIEGINSEAKTLVVAGMDISVMTDTEIWDRDIEDPTTGEEIAKGGSLEFSALRKGWPVKVKGKLRGDSVLEAAEIKVRAPDSGNDAGVEGEIQAIDKARGILTIMGFTIRTNRRTQIKFD